MNKLLLLTGKISLEDEIEAKIKNIGYEVLVSSELARNVFFQVDVPPIIQYFQVIVFSDSLPDDEIEQLIALIAQSQTYFVRLSKEMPSQEYIAQWQEKGIDCWITREMNPNSLRECLIFQKNKLQMVQQQAEQAVDEISVKANQAIDKLSQQEKKVFTCLYRHRHDEVPKEQLASVLGFNEISNSTKSRIYQIIRSIKYKFHLVGIDGEIIRNNWNRGYQLTEAIYQVFPTEKFQMIFQDYSEE